MAEVIGNLIAGLLTGAGIMALLRYIGSGRFLRGLAREMPRTAAALRTAWHWLRVRPRRKATANAHQARVAEAHQREADRQFWTGRLAYRAAGAAERHVARQMLEALPALDCPCREHQEQADASRRVEYARQTQDGNPWPAPRLTDHEYRGARHA